MKELLQGIQEFQSSYFAENRDLFEELGHGQTPRVLFITCSDSRIVPSLITHSDPGDLFVIRNAGNIIPPFGAANGGEGAAVEYAINALNITQIIVCGHNHCGAMKGLLKLNKLQEDMPLVYDWLKHTDATRRLLKDAYSHLQGEDLLNVAISENVITQMDNLKTHPFVRSRLQQGKLFMYGWIYEIETGNVVAYNADTQQFEAPQTQLYPEDGGTAGGARFVRTDAPPVDLPVKVVAPVASDSWLSQEQRDRIYRGSRR
jgi:carbonic anhydrase